MVTGYATPDLERRATAAGIDRILLKPCLPQVAMREVSRSLLRPALRRGAGAGRATEAVTRVRDEFARLPGLAVTAEQARLVFDLDSDLCDRILGVLLAEGFLSRTAEGAYRRDRN